jgi:hypothetical protein
VALPAPGEAGSVALMDILPPEVRVHYEHFNPKLFRPDNEIEHKPHVKLASDSEYIALILRMDAANMRNFRHGKSRWSHPFGV